MISNQQDTLKMTYQRWIGFVLPVLLSSGLSCSAFGANRTIEDNKDKKSSALAKNTNPTAPSCIGGKAMTTGFHVSDAGIPDKESFEVMEGPFGSQVKIGSSTFFLDPTEKRDKDSKDFSANHWCFITEDPQLLKKYNEKPGKPICDKLNVDVKGKSTGDDKDPLLITGSDKQSQLVKVVPMGVTDENGKKSIKLVLQSQANRTSGVRDINQISISGSIDKTGEKSFKGHLKVSANNVTTGKEVGSISSDIDGQDPKSGSADDKDPAVNVRLASCKSTYEGHGDLAKTKGESSGGGNNNILDLVGNVAFSRGTQPSLWNASGGAYSENILASTLGQK